MACVVRVVRVIDARRDGKQAIVVGVARTHLSAPISHDPAMTMRIDPITEVEGTTAAIEPARNRIETPSSLPISSRVCTGSTTTTSARPSASSPNRIAKAPAPGVVRREVQTAGLSDMKNVVR